MFELARLDTPELFLASIALLMLATQCVILVLNYLERHRFGTVLLGTLVTPICTGFPNLLIGLFGQERFQGDLVLQLNVGNNLANTSLVTGLLLFLAGPLTVRPGKGKGAAAQKALRDLMLALVFLWAGLVLLVVLAHDGQVGQRDGLLLSLFYFSYQALAFGARAKVGAKQRLGPFGLLFVLVALGLAAWLIKESVNGMATALNRLNHAFNGWNLGLFLGFLTVLPESFLLLRLARKQGSLGLSGLIGDCLVSIPLVIGVSAMAHPFRTTAFQRLLDPGARPYLCQAVTMAAISGLAVYKNEVPRKLGLLFIALYATVCWITSR